MENYAHSLAASNHYHYKINIGSSSNNTVSNKMIKNNGDSFSYSDKIKKDDEGSKVY